MVASLDEREAVVRSGKLAANQHPTRPPHEKPTKAARSTPSSANSSAAAAASRDGRKASASGAGVPPWPGGSGAITCNPYSAARIGPISFACRPVPPSPSQ